MAEYYFDIETYSPGEKPNPETDKIISIQFQRMDLETGRPIGDLIILKEWESSEEKIVKNFYDIFFREGLDIWNFVMVGNNLNFDFEFLILKFEKYLGKKLSSKDLHCIRPHFDIKPFLVMLNGGNFKGASLDKFTKKNQNGRAIKDYYQNKEYSKIEDYIKNETESFLEFLQKIISNKNKLLE